VSELDNKIQNVSKILLNRIVILEDFIEIYSKLNLIIGELKQVTQQAALYLEHLILELNMMSLCHLSPSAVTPIKLRRILKEIQSKLPYSLELPRNIERDLWYYYKFLTTATVLDGDKIYVIVSIPLLDQKGKYRLYKIYNLPIPMIPSKKDRFPIMVARYQLESKAIAVSLDQSHYVILTDDEIQKCANPSVNFCQLMRASYPMASSNLCVTSLFWKNRVKQNCPVIVQTNVIFPLAEYIENGHWIIATDKKIDFKVVCKSPKKYNYLTTIRPPLSVLKLNASCSASAIHSKLVLLPYYMETSNITISNKLLDISRIEIPKVWQPFQKAMINMSKTKIPKRLEEIKQISMDKLIDEIRSVDKVTVEDNPIPMWTYLIDTVAIILVIGIIIIIYKRFCKHRACFQRLVLAFRTNKPAVTSSESDHVGEIPMQLMSSQEGSKNIAKKEVNPASTQELASRTDSREEENAFTTRLPRLYPTIELTIIQATDRCSPYNQVLCTCELEE